MGESMKLKYIGNMGTQTFMLSIIIVPSVIMAIFIFVMSRGTQYKVTEEVTFEVSVKDEIIGSITIGLFGEAVPKTVANFVTFATTGFHGYYYNGTTFHRVIKKFMIQGGDVTHGVGTVSIYGPQFPDENFDVTHSGKGFVSMANYGKDTNGCQFFITCIATSWLDNSHVVFGKVVKGMDIVKLIENSPTDLEDRPMDPATIVKSYGEAVDTPYFVSDDPYNVYDWGKTILPPLSCTIVVILIMNYFLRKFDRIVENIEKMAREGIPVEERDKKSSKGAIEGEGSLIDLDEDGKNRGSPKGNKDGAVRKRVGKDK